MARNFLTSLRLVNISSDPPTGNEGELYYNTTTDKVRLYSNGAWIDLVAASAGSLFNVDAIAYPDYIAFDTTPESTSASVGTISWDSGEGGLNSQISENINITLGQEIIALAYNAEATTLNAGEVVYLFGAQGQRPSVKRAYNTSDATSAKTFGMVAESIASGAEGFIMVQGIVKNIDTNSYNEGDVLWLSSTPGAVTTTKPYAPNHGVFVGVVVKKNASSGRVFVKPQNGYEMDELHDVYAQSPSDNHILSYVSASTMWVSQSLVSAIAEIDGTGSGIDADLLDGQHGSYYAPIASPTFTGTVTAATLDLTTAATATAATSYWVETGSDGILRPKTLANTRTEIVTTAAVNSASATILGTVTSGIWQGSSISTTYTDAKVTSVNGSTGAITGLATTSGTLAQFAATTSSQLAGIISDETGSGSLVFATSPSLTTPNIGAATGTSVFVSGSFNSGANGKGGLTSKAYLQGASITNAVSHLTLDTPSSAQGERSGMSFYSTFQSTADNGSRRTADILAGFNGGAWGNEYLAFNVGLGGAANDGQSLTTERLRISKDSVLSTVPFIAPAATTSIPSIRLPHGTAPTAPTNGDMWTTTAGVYARINGATVGPIGTSSGGATINEFFLSGM